MILLIGWLRSCYSTFLHFSSRWSECIRSAALILNVVRSTHFTHRQTFVWNAPLCNLQLSAMWYEKRGFEQTATTLSIFISSFHLFIHMFASWSCVYLFLLIIWLLHLQVFRMNQTKVWKDFIYDLMVALRSDFTLWFPFTALTICSSMLPSVFSSPDTSETTNERGSVFY